VVLLNPSSIPNLEESRTSDVLLSIPQYTVPNTEKSQSPLLSSSRKILPPIPHELSSHQPRSKPSSPSQTSSPSQSTSHLSFDSGLVRPQRIEEPSSFVDKTIAQSSPKQMGLEGKEKPISPLSVPSHFPSQPKAWSPKGIQHEKRRPWGRGGGRGGGWNTRRSSFPDPNNQSLPRSPHFPALSSTFASTSSSFSQPQGNPMSK